ncbi:DUF7882 family protein [Agromyces litoreus]|uniref:DUF7882 family protein n=1 Tax=Agromyces litoreus TaxID=3158561 RepID=UPI003399AA7E
MGRLAYGTDGHHYEIDDATLRHVRAATLAKLRRREPFALTLHGATPGGMVETLWVQPSIPLRFVFESADAGELDRERLEKLVAAANSAGGMHIELEPSAPALAIAV